MGQAVPALVLDADCIYTMYIALFLECFRTYHPPTRVDHYFDHHPIMQNLKDPPIRLRSSGPTTRFSVFLETAGSSKCQIWFNVNCRPFLTKSLQNFLLMLLFVWYHYFSPVSLKRELCIESMATINFCHLNLFNNLASQMSLSVSNLWPLSMHFVYSLYK